MKRFQSLFLWIFRSYGTLILSWLPNIRCFNPCSYGSFVLTQDIGSMIKSALKQFQSLFLWIFRSYGFNILYFYDLLGGFNPCSYGSFVLTKRVLDWFKLYQHSFNPCSYGSFVLTGNKSYNSKKWKKVSILVLMDLSFLRELGLVDELEMLLVSILVLMDLSFLQF